jgi:RluA family pseudouridine synthase
MAKKEQLYFPIFEDEDIIVLNKPAGILTVPDRYVAEKANLYLGLKEKYGEEIYVVHRLDRDTSGIMVFAKNPEAHRILNTQFQEQKVTKIYKAILEGIVQRDDIDIDIPIAAHPNKVGISIPSARGKESLTKLKVVERYRNATYVECELVTGRHHQLRVHVAAIGHPLLVDESYGNKTEFLVSSIKKKFNLKKRTEELPIISRLTMHAFSLKFTHPTSSEEMYFEAEEPKDFKATLNVLSKYAKIKTFVFN